jgi:preprotein translocase subunit Sec61beta
METKYGVLKGVIGIEKYASGNLMRCKVTEKNILKTKTGELIPQYENKGERRKITGTLEFYENGDLKAISLDEKISIVTAAGVIPAEKIIFYPGDKIKRIFPLNGKLSGYWTEDKEYEMSEKVEINSNKIKIVSKFINVSFYENGNIKSLTLWPMERATFETKFGHVSVRKGISFYEDGSLKSFEPSKEIDISTPIGDIKVFNNEINGINGDINSVQIHRDGAVKSVYTCTNRIKIKTHKEIALIEPELKPGWCNELVKIPTAIKIDFLDDIVIFNEKDAYNIKKYKFDILGKELKTISEELICS